MRSLRYRIVTLSAVLLALAAGIVLGNGPLQGDETVATVSGAGGGDDLAAAEQRIDEQEQDLAFADSYAAATGTDLVADKLAGRAVTVVVLPGADPDTVDRVENTIDTAGGTVVSRVELDETLLDVAQRQLVAELAEQMDVGATQDAVRVPEHVGDYGRAARLLAYALLTSAKGGDQPDRVAEGILAGLTTAGLVAADGDEALTSRGSVAVVVGGAPYGSADERAGAGSILAELLAAFDRVADGTVLAAPVSASAPDGLVTAVRETPALAKAVSTVDEVNQAAGAIVVVLALAEDVAGRTGDYGSPAAADGPLPTGEGPDEETRAERKAERKADRQAEKKAEKTADNKKNRGND